MAFLAAIEVDKRQRIIGATNKLKEMMGGSWHIAETVREVLEGLAQGAGTARMVAPVSGAVWIRAERLDDLQRVLWAARERIVEERDLPATFAIVEYTDFREGKKRLESRVRWLKDTKAGEEATLLLPLMAVCQLEPNRAANGWYPERTEEMWQRRRLVSATQEARRERGQKTLAEYLDQFQSYKAAGVEAKDRWKEPEQFEHFAASDEDQYVGLLKADGDGMSALVATLDWDKLGEQLEWTTEEWKEVQERTAWPDEDRKAVVKAEQAFAWFSVQVERVLWDALREAVDATVGEQPKEKRYFPLVPLVREGEDTVVMCRRDLALKLAVEFGRAYERRAANNRVLNKALEVSGVKDRLSVSMGVLFVKLGYPFEMMWELAEELQGNAKKKRREEKGTTGYIDWEWFDSSGREEIEGRREEAERYEEEGMRYQVRTRPWTVEDAGKYLEAAEEVKELGQKRWAELEIVLRLGGELGELGWARWVTHLNEKERGKVTKAMEGAPHLGLGTPVEGKERHELDRLVSGPFNEKRCTPLLEMGLLLKAGSGVN